MRHARVIVLAGLAITVTAVAAFAAQTTVVPVPDNAPVQTAPLEVDLSKTHWGDAEAGASKAARAVATAMKSAEGAERHVRHRIRRTQAA